MCVHIGYVGSANLWLKVPPTEAKEAHANGLTRVVMGTGCLKLGFLHVQTSLFPQILSIRSHVEFSGAPATCKSSRVIFPARISGVIPSKTMLHFGGSPMAGSQYTSARWKISVIVWYDRHLGASPESMWKTVVALARKGFMTFSSIASSFSP
jgi:hypothetical protein